MQSNLTKVPNSWFQLLELFDTVRKQCDSNDMQSHLDIEQHALQLYEETVAMLNDRLKAHVENQDWYSEVVRQESLENKCHEYTVTKYRIHKDGLARVARMVSTMNSP